ncbi:hypothetical protein [Streptomyces olivaceiscleroticus]|uniref:hypothetical protein n=1 Tax=Streptomyces olivaceiscleroticus TaxID=68245 RepID=UPI0031F7AAFD
MDHHSALTACAATAAVCSAAAFTSRTTKPSSGRYEITFMKLSDVEARHRTKDSEMSSGELALPMERCPGET